MFWGKNGALNVVERSARCSSCGFKLMSNVKIIYVGAREYALLPISSGVASLDWKSCVNKADTT